MERSAKTACETFHYLARLTHQQLKTFAVCVPVEQIRWLSIYYDGLA